MMKSKLNNLGYISEINGSLITVKGIEKNVRLHDLVKIINYNIIGEIIQIYSNEIKIQCFENTENLRLNEKVQSLGEPLSMELAPGLLSNIFDGIQRPLDKIHNIDHSGFIKRGIDIPALSRDKKWHFSPKKKEGDKLIPGDVVGVVEESPAISHYILVPPDVIGTLISVKQEGEYTIIEDLYEVEINGTKKVFNMIQKWSVTKNRPYHKRLTPKEPLITGQRVLDLLFPVAKGGTVAVPGGFGTGKCVSGDTPVMISSGELINIKDLFDSCNKNNEISDVNSKQESLIKLEDNIEVFALNKMCFKKKKATHIYRGKTNKLIRIKTRTGREIKLTPIHKLHFFNGRDIIETSAKELKKGDFIAVPRKINIEGEEIYFNTYDMDDSLRVSDESALNKMKDLINNLKKKYQLKEIAKELNTNYKTFINYSEGINRPPLKFIKKLIKFSKEPPIKIKSLKAERQSAKLQIPEKLTNEFGEWLGLFVADGHIKGKYGGIYLYNTSKQILNRFKELTKIIFCLNAKYGFDSEERTPFMYIRNYTLTKFLYMIGIPEKDKTYKIRIPKCILKSKESILINFLNGYLVGDGWFFKYTLGFSTASQNLHIDLCYLLTRLGVLYRISKKKNSYFIELEGRRSEEIAKILRSSEIFIYNKLKPLFDYAEQNKPHFDSIDIIPINIDILKSLKQHGRDEFGHNIFRKYAGIRLDNYIKRKQNLSLNMLKQIYKTIEKYTPKIDLEIINYLKQILTQCENIYFDRIKEIEIINNISDVYDITVEDYHNFIGGPQPIILHNTVIQQSLAKWCNADIIVFIGCGERGNEIADVLQQFSKLIDPRNGRPLLERIVIIANTSNMPVSARESSIFSGITIAEYYRDMGYDVTLQADSTSRWAEALREISGLLEEMPAEGGYPAYLPSRLSSFYERAGVVETLGQDNLKHKNIGSLTVIGSVSPPAGDFSEPITSNTKRFVQTFWALDAELAYEKHYPAVNWLESYSNYPRYIRGWWKNVDLNWPELDLDWFECRILINEILSRENELKNMTQLVGEENLPEEQQLDIFIAEIIKEAILVQNAFDKIDVFTSPKKIIALVKIILLLYKESKTLLEEEYYVKDIKDFKIIEDILRIKYTIPNEEINKIGILKDQLINELRDLKRIHGVIGK